MPLVFGTVSALASPAVGEDQTTRARRLLRRWAPTFVQHVSPNADGRDTPTRIDFDGDWVLTNNWENQPRHGSYLPATVYASAVITERHAYLSYHLFYPQDWARPFCLPRVCHENDLESILLVVDLGERAALEGDGVLRFVETKTHRRYVALPAEQLVRSRRGRPLMWVEAQGHGLRACRRIDDRCSPGRGRVVYEPGGWGDTSGQGPLLAQYEERRRGKAVHYELLSLYETLWQQRMVTDGEADERWSLGASDGSLDFVQRSEGRLGATIGALMAGEWYGSAARPPWGLKRAGSSRGEWFLDPVRSVLQRYDLPGADDPGARRYVHNPYLADLRFECQGSGCDASGTPAGTRVTAAEPVPARQR